MFISLMHASKLLLAPSPASAVWHRAASLRRPRKSQAPPPPSGWASSWSSGAASPPSPFPPCPPPAFASESSVPERSPNSEGIADGGGGGGGAEGVLTSVLAEMRALRAAVEAGRQADADALASLNSRLDAIDQAHATTAALVCRLAAFLPPHPASNTIPAPPSSPSPQVTTRSAARDQSKADRDAAASADGCSLPTPRSDGVEGADAPVGSRAVAVAELAEPGLGAADGGGGSAGQAVFGDVNCSGGGVGGGSPSRRPSIWPAWGIGGGDSGRLPTARRSLWPASWDLIGGDFVGGGGGGGGDGLRIGGGGDGGGSRAADTSRPQLAKVLSRPDVRVESPAAGD